MKLEMNNIESIIEAFNNPDSPWGVDYDDLLLLEQEHYNCLSERNNLFQKDSIMIVIINPAENVPEYSNYKYIIKIFSEELKINDDFLGIEKDENITDVLEVKISEKYQEIQSNIYPKIKDSNIFNHLELINHDQLLRILYEYENANENETIKIDLKNIINDFKSNLLNLYMEIKKSWHN